tara:strand:- start:26 stop:448 length:423 start_codon:yes stop_codon:yes gene_type:complete
MIYILSGLLVSGVLTGVCWPLFVKSDSLDSAILEETEWDLVQRRKEVILGNIQDLDFEYKCGKLSEEDYKSLRREMTGEAAAVMGEIDSIENSQDLDALIRREMASRKAIATDLNICPSCNHANIVINKFCAECGSKMES